MANIEQNLAQFEFHKMQVCPPFPSLPPSRPPQSRSQFGCQLIHSLGAVADTMRNCAAIAEQFAQIVSASTYGPPMHHNGQFAVPALPPLLAPGRGKRKAGEDMEGHKVKRPRKPKDPNAPKRPASSYLLFQNEIRQDLKAKNPNMPNNELLGLIAKMWKDMSRDEKDTYEARQKLAKDQWLADKSAYKASKDAAASEDVVVASPSETAEVPVAKPAAEASSDSSDETSTEGEDHGSSSSSASEDEDEASMAQHVPKKVKKHATAASSSTIPTSPPKAKKSRTGA
ncbi:hypothetical protein NLI96_g12831 [Meripilus lineatus]|uniref:HMG box domain-containing protein n=1 Tax=Meripilus lineatus TaxID=2056292 RepID=A0AAD5Y9I2_9APHY|nr:hypothetical protein NLI96_g12831 [Physisporinus lineatus]